MRYTDNWISFPPWILIKNIHSGDLLWDQCIFLDNMSSMEISTLHKALLNHICRIFFAKRIEVLVNIILFLTSRNYNLWNSHTKLYPWISSFNFSMRLIIKWIIFFIMVKLSFKCTTLSNSNSFSWWLSCSTLLTSCL